MPMRPLTVCLMPCCQRPTRGGYCDLHRQAKPARYDKPRASSARRGYGERWRRLRRMHLAAEPMCRMCGAPAEDVDHVIPKSAGGDPFAEDNLQSLCHACHSRKTGGERARRGGG